MKLKTKEKILITGLIFTFLLTLTLTYANSVSRDIKNSVLRLHIVANSNSDADQNLKLKVRDRIIAESSYLFKDTNSPKEATEIASANLEKICAIAEDEIKKQGFSYTVNAKLGTFPFPTKTYGDITLPSGKYDALKIEIGESKGENWWCVMYPPLCFTDGVLAASESAKLKLKNSLTKEEYNLLTKEQSGSLPVEIRFKIVEVFQNIF